MRVNRASWLERIARPSYSVVWLLVIAMPAGCGTNIGSGKTRDGEIAQQAGIQASDLAVTPWEGPESGFGARFRRQRARQDAGVCKPPPLVAVQTCAAFFHCSVFQGFPGEPMWQE